jgi:hypothetical protein
MAKYEDALADTTTRQRSRGLWHAYERARRQQREVYHKVLAQWEVLFTQYQQLLLAQQHAPQ